MRAVVVNCFVKGHKQPPLSEMKNLLSTLEIDIDLVCEQNIDHISQSIYLGSGLLMRIGEYVKENEINCVVFNNDLSPLQIRNISSICDCEVYDRSMVIIKIFQLRASSKEAKLQVEIASLKYTAARLIDREKNYSQITSGGAGGLQNRGSGEKEIVRKKYLLKTIIKHKEDELANIVLKREQQRKSRNESLPIVAIVGYTNAGKSTLMNNFIRLTNNNKKDLILQEDRLFATLQTSTRLIKVDSFYPFLITDTVGFISDLPTPLIKAFRSTLEEINEADILINVVDVSSKKYEDEILVTKNTLKEIGITDKPTIFIYNKYDLMEKNQPLPPIGEFDLITSLSTLEDMTLILELIDKLLSSFYVDVQLFIPYEESDVYFDIKNNYAITSSKQIDYGYDVICKIDKRAMKKYQKYLIFKSSLGID